MRSRNGKPVDQHGLVGHDDRSAPRPSSTAFWHSTACSSTGHPATCHRIEQKSTSARQPRAVWSSPLFGAARRTAARKVSALATPACRPGSCTLSRCTAPLACPCGECGHMVAGLQGSLARAASKQCGGSPSLPCGMSFSVHRMQKHPSVQVPRNTH